MADSPGLFDAPVEPRVWSVAALTREIGERVSGLGRVVVEGEVSGLKRAASGHVYLDLKDANSRLSCAIWRSRVRQAVRFELEEGAQVVAHGRLEVYAPRGSYSLIVDRLEPRGVGALLAQLEERKRALRERGWFERARPLPALPRTIGVVTSRDGAALRDFLRTRSLRWPLYPVRLCHSPVQGPGAAEEIAAAVRALDASGVDVIVVTRGGGSLEDLWAFNELPVAEAIWEAGVPVVSAVGHESDVSLADHVADLRAHTPTDAAQTVIPDRGALLDRLERGSAWLVQAMDRVLSERLERAERCARSRVLRSADWILDERRRALGAAGVRLKLGVRRRLDAAGERVRGLHAGLERRSPRARLERWDARLRIAHGRLAAEGARALEAAGRELAVRAASLEAISPLAVLARGYSVARLGADGAPLVDAGAVKPGDELHTRLHRGSVVSRVERTDEDAS